MKKKVSYFNENGCEVAAIYIFGRLAFAKKVATRHAKNNLQLVPDGNWKHSHASKHVRNLIRRGTGSKYRVVVDEG